MLRLGMMGAAALLAGDAAERTVVAGEPIAATVSGVPARLLLDPAGASIPIMNPDFAARAEFKAGMFGSRALIGPVAVNGRTAVIRFDLGAGEYKRRTGWFDKPVVEGADGLIGPGSVPSPRVRFVLRPAEPGERDTVLPLADFGFAGMGVRVPVGEDSIAVRFTLERDDTLATAGAGAALAAVLGGALSGAVQQVPIRLGVARPVRTLTLATPFVVGPIALRTLSVRTGDFGSTAGVTDADRAADPDEIVVTGTKKQQRRLTLTIGRAALAGCSSILFDKPGRRVVLHCR